MDPEWVTSAKESNGTQSPEWTMAQNIDKATGQPKHRVKIVLFSQMTGYDATAASDLFMSVYFSNQSKRTQAAGRIDRHSQVRSHVYYTIVSTSLLSYILDRYEGARNLESALNDMAKEAGAEE